MFLKTKDFQKAVKVILYAIDTKSPALLTETLELKTEGSTLYLNVTNREYFVTVKFTLPESTEFHAAVNAKLFLNLISKCTTDTIEITSDGDKSIKVKADGEYRLPIIYDTTVKASEASMLTLPQITIDNVTSQMTINGSILNSIANFNSKELLRGVISKPVQRYYYVDEFGAITFTSGACVNSFTLEKPVKLLLSDKVVKLFKLFDEDQKVTFTLGQDAVTEDIIQTKVRFSTDSVTITAKLSDSGLISTVPVTAIRSMADTIQNYSAIVNKESLLSAINRMLLFIDDSAPYGKFEFSPEGYITIYDMNGNKEEVTISNKSNVDTYSFNVNLDNFKLMLEGSDEEFVTITFGSGVSVVVKRANISDMIKEIKLK